MDSWENLGKFREKLNFLCFYTLFDFFFINVVVINEGVFEYMSIFIPGQYVFLYKCVIVYVWVVGDKPAPVCNHQC